MKKPEDTKSAEIKFGIEIETHLPADAHIAIGGYHRGVEIDTWGAPTFQGKYWKAERDGSIRPTGHNRKGCEFVSPILWGDEGLAKLSEFLEFARNLGARVNRSCGLHITVDVASIIGTTDTKEVAHFAEKVVRHAHEHEWAIYAQTGSDRHRNRYSHTWSKQIDERAWAPLKQAKKGEISYLQALRAIAGSTGRGMVNLSKIANSTPVIEFRAFAASLNDRAVLHHIATVFALCRKRL